ncbi:hypothetical protein [Desulfonatronum sp. SC1]|uniref:hypothetical protein n=1 Tax=Desulfonatronum sp. SC1 TaxID=2109626 RepID=UPI000D31240B|nr:hypothetical protein [Desulfonatronum sp. SC1]PTN34442.1 hypothetical protein C6366_12600 [Desulfonatronum sp. SC1]
MKIVRTEILIDAGGFSTSPEWQAIQEQLSNAIRSVEWPPGSGSFILHDESGKKRGQGSGVTPIKDACMLRLKDYGWSLETPVDIAAVRRPGKMDATLPVGERLFCVEWETGNISSSHRAVNKMALGLLKGALVGGALVVPSRKMYKYLTDRIGNFQELEPYFPLWRSVPVRNGVLAVIAIEHDGVSKDVPRIGKGTDGRALQ